MEQIVYENLEGWVNQAIAGNRNASDAADYIRQAFSDCAISGEQFSGLMGRLKDAGYFV